MNIVDELRRGRVLLVGVLLVAFVSGGLVGAALEKFIACGG